MEDRLRQAVRTNRTYRAGMTREDEAAAALVSTLRSDDPYERLAAVEALDTIDDAGNLSVVRQAMLTALSDPDAAVRLAAVRGVAAIYSDLGEAADLRQRLGRLFVDRDQPIEVRNETGRTLCRMKAALDSSYRESALEILSRALEPVSVRRWALRSLAFAAGDTRVRQAIQTAGEDADAAIRLEAQLLLQDDPSTPSSAVNSNVLGNLVKEAGSRLATALSWPVGAGQHYALQSASGDPLPDQVHSFAVAIPGLQGHLWRHGTRFFVQVRQDEDSAYPVQKVRLWFRPNSEQVGAAPNVEYQLDIDVNVATPLDALDFVPAIVEAEVIPD